MKPNSKNVNISFDQVFLKVIIAELYYNLLLMSNKAIIEDIKISRQLQNLFLADASKS